jgi:hypothetical protein
MSTAAVLAIGAASTRFVAPERTAVSVGDIQGAIARAYNRIVGAPPSANVLKTLSAQAVVETGAGRSMYNFNFGGVKGASPAGQSAECLTHEVIGGTDVTVHQQFRAYSTLDEGADDYVRLMLHRFGGAMPSAAQGDLDGFAHALKQAGYYTAGESDYAVALKSASAALPDSGRSGLLPVPSPTSLPTSVDITRVFDALSRSALRIADPDA